MKSYVRPIVITFLACTLLAWATAELQAVPAVQSLVAWFNGAQKQPAKTVQKKAPKKAKKPVVAAAQAAPTTAAAKKIAAAAKKNTVPTAAAPGTVIRLVVPASPLTVPKQTLTGPVPTALTTNSVPAAGVHIGALPGVANNSPPTVNDPPTYSVPGELQVPSPPPAEVIAVVGDFVAVSQSLVGVGEAPGTGPVTNDQVEVPEPGTLVLASLAIAGAGLKHLRRRRRRRRQSAG